MTEEQGLPSYNTINESLKILHAQGDASENHGLLSALFSSGSSLKRTAWINSLSLAAFEKGDIIAEGAKKALIKLFDVTQAHFSSDEYEFSLLLPSDDDTFLVRIEALAHWCQGYVIGLNLVGVDTTQKGDSDVHEALADLVNFSLLRYDNESKDDEEAEKAFSSLVEYSKVAVLLLQRDYNKLRVTSRNIH